MAKNIIDKWNDYVAALRGEAKQQPLDDSTMVFRKKKRQQNRLRRKFARQARKRNRNK